MSEPSIGSLCTGYGGLDRGVQAVLGGRRAWVADNDPGATAVLTAHHPDVPNLGNLTAVDWAAVRSVDIVTAGFLCQDISYAGRGAGIQEGNRSGLWHTIADALRVLRPRLVVLENVAAIVARRPGLDVVLADLAALGFDAVWTCVRASDVGAAHQRERWFLLAHPAGQRLQGPRLPGRVAGGRGTPADTHGLRHDRAAGEHGQGRRAVPAAGPPADAQGDGRDEPARLVGRPDAALGRDAAAADAARAGFGQQSGGPPAQEARQDTGHLTEGDREPRADADWGLYRPAIARWERVTGRAAPDPIGLTAKRGRGLSPVFVEWLMGLPAGHVTAVPGLSRNQMLKLLGNGVVPRQAEHALRILLDEMAVAA